MDRGALPFCHVRLTTRKPDNPTYPKAVKTLGDHLRKRRMDLGLLQREVALQLGVDPMSVNSWEVGRTVPQVRFIPAVITFLGYDPHPEPVSFAAWVTQRRKALGFSRRRLAAELGVDESTLSRWESGRGKPLATLLDRLRARLGSDPP